MLINADIKEIIYSGDYPDDLAKKIIDESDINIRNFNKKKTYLLSEK
jgi:deoxycytidylate deaminase